MGCPMMQKLIQKMKLPIWSLRTLRFRYSVRYSIGTCAAGRGRVRARRQRRQPWQRHHQQRHLLQRSPAPRVSPERA